MIKVFATALFGLLLLGGCVADPPGATQDLADAGADGAECLDSCTPSCDGTEETVCLEIAPNCFVQETRNCESGTVCNQSVGSCATACDTCEVGTKRCTDDGEVVEVCVMDDNSCTEFEADATCAPAGLCIENGSTVECVDHECDRTDFDCVDNQVINCEPDADTGLRTWVPGEVCALDLQFCDDTDGTCECLDECGEAPRQYCEGTRSYRCVLDPMTGCYQTLEHPCQGFTEGEAIMCSMENPDVQILCDLNGGSCLLFVPNNAKPCVDCMVDPNGGVSCAD